MTIRAGHQTCLWLSRDPKAHAPGHRPEQWPGPYLRLGHRPGRWPGPSPRLQLPRPRHPQRPQRTPRGWIRLTRIEGPVVVVLFEGCYEDLAVVRKMVDHLPEIVLHRAHKHLGEQSAPAHDLLVLIADTVAASSPCLAR